MDNSLPGTNGVELMHAAPHLHGQEGQPPSRMMNSNPEVNLPAAVNGAAESLSQAQVSQVRVSAADEGAAQYNLRKNG